MKISARFESSRPPPRRRRGHHRDATHRAASTRRAGRGVVATDAPTRAGEGVYLATEPSLLWRLSFDAIDALAGVDPRAYAAVCRLVAAELADENRRSQRRLGALVDALHSKPLREPLPRAALRALATLP